MKWLYILLLELMIIWTCYLNTDIYRQALCFIFLQTKHYSLRLQTMIKCWTNVFCSFLIVMSTENHRFLKACPRFKRITNAVSMKPKVLLSLKTLKSLESRNRYWEIERNNSLASTMKITQKAMFAFISGRWRAYFQKKKKQIRKQNFCLKEKTRW